MDIRFWRRLERSLKMINHEVTYERDISRSYMKIPAIAEKCLDEKLMFRKEYQGILPMEKCYVNGCGQYWYNISGRQALDTYCKMNGITHEFFEMLILSICRQLEILEWNLIDARCLVVDPEYIFVNSSGEEVSFILYPDTKGNFLDELRQLMEYLLTKLNHSDKDGVHKAYRIYHKTLTEGYSIADLKQTILEARSQKEYILEESIEEPFCDTIVEQEEPLLDNREDIFQKIEKKINQLLEHAKRILLYKKENKEEIPMVVYPEDKIEDVPERLHPTICLTAALGEPQGVLIYEGRGDYPDFELAKGSCILGKNPRVKLYLGRETISQFHAKFDYYDKKYYVEDMNSTNGTFVNDEMLCYKEQRELVPGDVLCFADVKYRFL